MRAGGGEDAWYAPRVALRHVRGVAARNLRVPSANGERFANRDARDGDVQDWSKERLAVMAETVKTSLVWTHHKLSLIHI